MYAIRSYYDIVGIKDTVDCMSHIRRLVFEVKGARPDFMVFSGFDEYVLDTLMIGGDGVIPATSNRITSYNVCYTKLLRPFPTATVG